MIALTSKTTLQIADDYADLVQLKHEVETRSTGADIHKNVNRLAMLTMVAEEIAFYGNTEESEENLLNWLRQLRRNLRKH